MYYGGMMGYYMDPTWILVIIGAVLSMTGDQMLPVSFKNIEGAYGVNSGTVEIVNVETGDVINSYSVTFIPVPQS